MRGYLVVGLLITVTLAGCLGSDEPDAPAPEAEPRPDMDPGMEDAALSAMGRWSGPFDGEVPAVNMVLLDDGRILYWSGLDAREGATETDILGISGPYPEAGESRLLDLSGEAPNVTTPLVPQGGGFDLFCSGQTIMPDGRVLIAGGTFWEWIPDGTVGIRGTQDARIFDPETGAWNTTTDMILNRWYPSVITASDGTTFSIGGIGHWVDPTEHWASWEAFDEATQSWSEVPGTDQRLPLYPRVYEVAGGPLKGQFFVDTVGALWAPFGEHPEQHEWSYQWAFDRDGGTWTNLGLSDFGARSYGGNQMLQLDPARDHAPEFVTFGGSLQQGIFGVPFVERTDLSSDPPTRQRGADMETARWHPLSVLLPDGDVMAIGGSVYDNVAIYSAPTMPPIYENEVYDPDTDTWSPIAPMNVERVYHSTALLLPDGRVLVGGHVPDPNYFGAGRKYINPQPYETRLEIYEPGYLFRGERPLIVDAPDNATYAQTITLDVELPADLDRVVLIRPGATTHTYDGSNRHVILEVVEQVGTNVTVQMPPDAVVAPPGHHMIMVLSEHDEGPVPSVAKWLHLA